MMYEEFDKNILVNPFEKRKSDYISGMGWTRSDSEIEGVFDSRLPGHRCAWSVVWESHEGHIEPKYWMPLDAMTSGELIAEASDVIHRMPQDVHIGDVLVSQVLQYYEGTLNPEVLMQEIIKGLNQVRVGYEHFTCPWIKLLDPGDPTNTTLYTKLRPGWS